MGIRWSEVVGRGERVLEIRHIIMYKILITITFTNKYIQNIAIKQKNIQIIIIIIIYR